MKAAEIREFSREELENKESELKDQLFKLKFQHSLGQLENTMKLKHVKRDIARVKAVLGEKNRDGIKNEQ